MTPLVLLTRALPPLVLVASTLTIALTSPGGHYGLLLALVPLLAAAAYGVVATAALGAVTVGTYAVLRDELGNNPTAMSAVKLGLIGATSLLGVMLSWSRTREQELRRTRDTALTLQQGLLPRDFPPSTAVAVGHYYVPADTEAGVGGDWFDVIPLSGARVALVMGDVVGHGLNAAATMGSMRTAVHTLADLDLEPEEVLARMDDLVATMSHDHAEDELVASCLYMVYDPISRQCDIASAGHTPPMFVMPDGRTEIQPQTRNPPLGSGTAPFETALLTLPEGTVIALYTDGLLDLRRREVDEALRALADRLTPATGPLQDLCKRVIDGAPPVPDDDIALLLARTRVLDRDHVAGWEFPALPEEVPAARTSVTERLTAWGLDEHVFTMELVVTELVTNAVQHAKGPIGLRLIHDKALICEVSDESSTSPYPRRAQPLDEGGRGLYLVGHLMDRWGTRYTRSGKTIWASKYLR